MGTDLHQALRSLCLNTEWNYAIFWKLKHRARMVLTWEDAYYDNCEQHDNSGDESFIKTLEALPGGHNPHDPLGLAVAKMSYHVYTLGEGIVGQVAITGKYQWIFADNIVRHNCSPSEYGDGWHSQFLAGIRTVAIVAVVPHGVVQLGSLNKITENVKLVSHIKNAFMAQDSPVRRIQSSIDSSGCEAISPTNLASGAFPDCLQDIDKAINIKKSDIWLSAFPQCGKDDDSSYMFPLTRNLKNAVEVVNKHGELESSNIGGDETSNISQSKSSIFNLGSCKLVGMELLDSRKCTGESSGCKNLGMSSPNNATSFSHANDCADLSSTFVNSDRVDSDNIDFYRSEVLLHVNEPSDVKFQNNLENLKFQAETGQVDTSSSSLMFPAGCELHEALGPSFMNKSNYFDWEAEKIGDRITAEMPDGMNSSQLTSDSCPEHLLEAVVAKVCHSGSHVKSEKSFCKSMQSLLTTEKYPEPSSHTTHTLDSENYSIDQPSMRGEDTQQCLSSSGRCGVISPKWFSSPCPSACSEQQERSSGPAKNNKKRARPGETSRPRPRDRQLIQDRIKELRELTPNGAKCSIDSLLERTIKHMLFLQSITKHADKLNKCADAKLCPKETSMLGSSNHERGSSWAVEVGGNLKVCSIVVENLNKNGQMVVEMMCEECSHFLEIAEAIRSLGLTILKGVTEARGDKTWICFIVEGQNNRNIHRMDILWSLVQILQPENPIQQQL
ncbi:transcription factor bHLH155 [Argentina anserina]|uniref:transcription factor bHLH155 n=1 Tax=Argentina anserina TaxID=57926 RepID=UPI0021764F34|nr:transcription factor bHLH155 [Potentilla anserina]